MTRQQDEQEFGKVYRQPGLGAHLLAFLLSLFPKVAFFKFLSFQPPNPQMEMLFQQSFQTVTARYGMTLQQLRSGPANLSNEDLDTNKPTARGEYALADQTYAKLLDKLASHQFAGISTELRADILRFYSSSTNGPVDPAEKRKDREKTQKELAKLKSSGARQ
jgi:hypothetical protein